MLTVEEVSKLRLVGIQATDEGDEVQRREDGKLDLCQGKHHRPGMISRLREVTVLQARSLLDGRGLADNHPSPVLAALARELGRADWWGPETAMSVGNVNGTIALVEDLQVERKKAVEMEHAERAVVLEPLVFDDRLAAPPGVVADSEKEAARARVAARWATVAASFACDTAASIATGDRADTLRAFAIELRDPGCPAVSYRRAAAAIGKACQPDIAVAGVADAAYQAATRASGERDLVCPAADAAAREVHVLALRASSVATAGVSTFQAAASAYRALTTAAAGDYEAAVAAVVQSCRDVLDVLDAVADLRAYGPEGERSDLEEARSARPALRETFLEMFQRVLDA